MFIYSISLIVPSALQDKANRLACALQHDELPGDTFTAQLSSDGTTIDHYGCHTYARQAFVDVLTAASQGTLPPVPWEKYGLAEKDVRDVLQALTIKVAKGTVADTWPACKKAAGVETLQETGI